MIAMSRSSVVVVGGVALIAAAAVGVFVWSRNSSQLVLDAPPPRVVADTLDAISKVPASTIEALVTYNLATAVDSLEATVPRAYGDITHRLPIANNTRAS